MEKNNGNGGRRIGGRKPFIDIDDSSSKPLTEFEKKKIQESLYQITENWWGKKWLESILSEGKLRRMARGINYYLNGHVQDIYISNGLIFAMVKGTAPLPYRVKLTFKSFEYSTWVKIYEEILKKPHIYMGLLENSIASEIQQIAESKGINFFPGSKLEEYATCNCPDKEVPCKHIAAVTINIAKILDIDPFQLFVIRGKKRENVLEDLRELKANKMSLSMVDTKIKNKSIKFSFDVPPIRVGDFKQNRTLNSLDRKMNAIFELDPPGNPYNIIKNLQFYAQIENKDYFFDTLSTIVDDAANLAFNLGKNIKNPKTLDENQPG